MTATASTARVVVGIDGSKDADAALRWAEQYASATGASIRLVTAWGWPVSYGYPIAYGGYSPEIDAREVAEKAQAELSLPADRVEAVVVEGHGGPVLVDASQDADLLVIGCHGHGAVASALLGSVSGYCVHHAKVPVVVVR
jgi:nucleotide-binding universal stress UspA family protein